ncbi:CaiB/BaiF CoA transferase family protein [Chloroflexota bacterium]
MGDESVGAMALSGIRVLDCCTWVAAATGSVLTNMGADVIKVERSVSGDTCRGFLGRPRIIDGQRVYPASYFEVLNCGKRSVALDLNKQGGKEALYRLVKHSDIFIHNFIPGVAEQLAIDYSTLKKFNPRLIYASQSGYGLKGPDRSKPGFDPLVASRAGFMSTAGEPGRPPLLPPRAVVDQLTALMTACGILTAIVARERTGIGQEVHNSLLGSAAWIQRAIFSEYSYTGKLAPKVSRWETELVNTYQCADENWLVLCCLPSDKYWPDLCKALDIESLVTDDRFNSLLSRFHNAGELTSLLDRIFASHPRDHWLTVLGNLGIPSAPVNDFDELAKDPQMIENEYIRDFVSSKKGLVKIIALPIQMSETPVKAGGRTPELGEHTEQVLIELGGYNWDEIKELRGKEVF